LKGSLHAVVLALVLAGSFVLKLHHLDHAAVKPLDEVFHAIVARNLLKHPLLPTLVDRPYLPYDYRDWQSSHIWLHKPPMALWQTALSYAILGVNGLALRLPSAILSTLAAWMTYLIGKELLDRTAGLIASALQAFNPTLLMMVHGYVFSDQVDVSLLFWTEVAILFLARGVRSGRSSDMVLCGVAQGLAFLSKNFPALVVTGLVVVAWLLPRTRLAKRDASRVVGRGVLVMLAATVAVVMPWMIYIFVRFPVQARYDNLLLWQHFNRNVEHWAAPWDRVIFTYWIEVFHVYYPAVLAAAAVLTIRAARHRQMGLWLVLAWAAGVTLPNLLVVSKTMTASLLGWPAMWLLLGYLIWLALCGDAWALGTWLAAMLLAAIFLNRASIPQEGWGYDPHGSIMLQHLWVIWHVVGALAMGAGVAWIMRRRTGLRRPLVMVVTLAMLYLGVRWWKGAVPRGYAYLAWEVTQIDKEHPNFLEVGQFAQTLPANAAFIVDESDRLENKLLEFAADRSCYPMDGGGWRQQASALTAAGALPYVVSSGPQALPAVFIDRDERHNIYAATSRTSGK